MLKKGAIERVANKSSSIPKKNSRLRLIIDLRSFTCHLTKERFDIETSSNLRHSIQKGDWVISVDLTEAYLHVPIHLSTRMFLRFLWQKKVFQFRVLPFGLSVSLRVFTRMVDAMMVHVRSLTDSSLSRRLVLEKQAGGPPQGSNSEPSSLSCLPRLGTLVGVVGHSESSPPLRPGFSIAFGST